MPAASCEIVKGVRGRERAKGLPCELEALIARQYYPRYSRRLVSYLDRLRGSLVKQSLTHAMN